MTSFKRSRTRSFEHQGEKYLLLALAGAFILLVSMMLFAASGRNRLQNQLNEGMEIIAASIQRDVSDALSSYRAIDRKSADLEGDILPTMEKHMHSAHSMNRVLVEIFGEEYSMIDETTYEQFETVMAEFDRLLAAGQSTSSAKELLVPCMNSFQNMLLNRFTEDGKLLPIQ